MSPVLSRSDLAAGLAELGIGRADTVLAHVSMSSFGYVAGGAAVVCAALLDAAATVVMPSFTPQLCHPSSWPPTRRHGVDIDAVAAEIPAFDPRRTPVAASIGAVAECMRSWPGTHRSGHPHTSFVAHGSGAAEIVAEHPLDYRLSASSPLGRLVERDAKAVLLGVPWSKCTALHLGEYEADYPGRRRGRWLVPLAGAEQTCWSPVDELMVWEGDFNEIGAALLAAEPSTRVARIGTSDCIVVRMRAAVSFATEWLAGHRDLSAYADAPGWRDVVSARGLLRGIRGPLVGRDRDIDTFG